jgi:hypothetical protein
MVLPPSPIAPFATIFFDERGDAHCEFFDLRGQLSAQEWQTRTELAGCNRLVDYYGMTDLIYKPSPRASPAPTTF